MIAIISDIHGNYAALSAVLKEIDRMGIADIICLGDVCGYYSQINEVCEALRGRDVFTLMGNHDWYIAHNEECPRSNSANKCLEFQQSIITPANRQWIQGLSPKGQWRDISIVHGGWHDNLDEYIKPSAEYFLSMPGRLFASGHTHVPCVWQHYDKAYCNPGSVGQPRDGNPKASFATFSSNVFSIHRVTYDVVWVQRDMQDAGFSSYFYSNLLGGTRIGGGVDVAFS